MTQTADPRLGTTVGGYRIDSMIGRGGMSVVYLAEDAHLGRKVAVKFLAPDLVQDSKFRERFVRESRLAASLEHPNIVTVYEAREHDGQLYLAMRYVAGTDLKRLIGSEGALDPERTVSIVSQAASALDAAHAEGLIHRDVKPGNILITPRTDPGGRDRVYLSDFGLTKRATSDSGITATGQFVGTLDYAAPEQFEAKPQDARADVYSLGCVLYECLTGEVPFPRENQAALVYAHLHAPPPKVTAVRPDLPGAIDHVVATAMAKAPQDRYRSAGELADTAAQALGVQPVAPTTPTGPAPRRGGPGHLSRNRLLLIGAGVLAVVAVVVGLALANRGGSSGATTGPGTLVDYVARLDPNTREVAAKIPVGEHPVDVAVGEGSVWVLDKDGSVRRLDPVTNKATVIEGIAEDPRAIAAGEGAVWVADGAARVIRKVDPATNRVVGSIPMEGLVRDVATGGGAVWAVRADGQILRVDPVSGATSFPGAVPGLAGAPPADAFIGVSNRYVWGAIEHGSLARILIETDVTSDSTDLQIGPRGLSAYRDSAWVAACGTPGTVIRIDETGDKTTIAAGGALCRQNFQITKPIAIAAGAEGVWVTDGVNGTVSRIQNATNQVDAPIRVGDTPTAVAAGLGSVWVTVDGEGSPSPSTS
jgi:streptogramin lyase/tRNA A-37 threonylcarbamoyl transferase component Bud32